MCRVPLVIVCSPSFIERRPQAFAALSSNRGAYWTNDLVYDLMTGLLGIEDAPQYDRTLDLASSDYRMTRAGLRTLHGARTLPDEHNEE